ncbi:MAG: hypothetical protein C4519_16465 [Desulfobacteraceae bacterium]|nr:MAG: hypothetical protein C4519_16465 [Desulfobacteraceae bacterium]
MTVWFSKNLGDAMFASEALGQIEALFVSKCTKAGCPKEMALFIRHESEGRLHCEVKAYFSPAAADVAREIGASPCQKPFPDGLSLAAGAEECWSVLFPER